MRRTTNASKLALVANNFHEYSPNAPWELGQEIAGVSRPKWGRLGRLAVVAAAILRKSVGVKSVGVITSNYKARRTFNATTSAADENLELR